MVLLFILKVCMYSAILMCLSALGVQLYIRADNQDVVWKKFFGFYLAVMNWVFTLILVCWVSYDVVMSLVEIIGGIK